MKECPNNKQGNGNQGNRISSSSFASQKRAAPERAIRGGANRHYAIISHQEQENYPNVITCMINVFTLYVYDFLDPR